MAGIKTGRKGDKRMHAAVAARLKNPKLSLFDALKVGGFVYKNDDDPNLVDSENVSLAQRKNQLSRRVRLAKRQPHGNTTDGGLLDDDPSMVGGEEETISTCEHKELLAKNHPGFHAHSVSVPVIPQRQSTCASLSNGGPPDSSGMAIRTLSKTASAAGMSLEQLAVALSNKHTVLPELLKNTMSQQQVAINHYNSEIKTLYTRAMHAANYPPEVCNDPHSAEYLQFAIEAWRKEGQRLQALQNFTCNEPPLQANVTSDNNNNNKRVHSDSCAFEDGRHMHRLDECGHVPILHQPENGPSHIDFLVGNQVECYLDIAPVSTDDSKLWPSKYKCQELHCDACPKQQQQQQEQCAKNNSCVAVPAPRLLDVEELDWNGSEWSMDVNGESLLGMFKLGSDPTGVILGDEERSEKRQKI